LVGFPLMDSKRWRIYLGRVALVVTGPVVFFAGVEIALHLTGRFEPVEVLRQVEYEGRRYWVMEPEYTRRVLGRDNVGVTQTFFLPVERTPGTRRVVLLGESAAAGYPLTEFGLGRMMSVIWEMEFPGEKLEVVDMTCVGVNSHVLRVFSGEGLRTNPDAVVLYAGNNEIIGPYGAANVFGRQAPSLFWAQAGLAAGNTRTGQFIGWLVEQMSGVTGEKNWRGLDEFAGMNLGWDDPAVVRAAKQSKENFEAILKKAKQKGRKVLVCVPAVNLTDWPPTARNGQALAAFEKAEKLQAAGKMEEAWKFYRRACDLDEMRFRADSRVREVQREVVAEMATKDVVLVDADIWLHEGNPGLLTDRDFFLEHVHLTFEGRVAVAALMVDGLASLLGKERHGWDDPREWWPRFPSRVSESKERTMFTPAAEGKMWEAIGQLLEMEVFSNVPGIEGRRKHARIREAESKSADLQTTMEVLDAYRRALAKNPDDPILHAIAGSQLRRTGNENEAEKATQKSLEIRPNMASANLEMAMKAIRSGRTNDAMKIAEKVSRFQSGPTELDGIKAAIIAEQGNLREALRILKCYTKRFPEDTRALGLLASLLGKKGNLEGAEKFYRKTLLQNPESPTELNNLAWLLATRDGGSRADRTEAVQLARRAVKLDNEAHRFRGTLAVALVANGQLEEGRAEAEKAIEMAVAAGDGEAVAKLRERMGDVEKRKR
jgi:tetratricopeptide (TPR) repeat protein